MEKFVKEEMKDGAAQAAGLEEKLGALEKAMRQVLESVRTLGPSSLDQAEEPPQDTPASVSALPDPDVVERIRNAAEIGDLTELTAIAEALKSQSEALAPFCDRIIQLAEDFEFEGITQMVNDLEKSRV